MLPILHSTCKLISHAEVFFKEAPLKNVAHGRVPFQLESFRLKSVASVGSTPSLMTFSD